MELGPSSKELDVTSSKEPVGASELVASIASGSSSDGTQKELVALREQPDPTSRELVGSLGAFR